MFPIQSFEEKIPLTPKEEVEKKLASMLIQVQQNRVKRLDLTAASRPYPSTKRNPWIC